MGVIEQGQLAGEFEGYEDQNTVFEFCSGGKWRQARFHFEYHYAYMPQAKVIQEDGKYVLYVSGAGKIEVERAYVTMTTDLFSGSWI
ncbi:hypothetical protein OR16_04737 [Cupriavidus basilensis OR16]|uniref:Uncharacterized protein n=1 Tax=Cupriavidus basilensis OR16 TaxID=1127483 RepID=H1S039_9BURK|nr:hypothetical protein [Cupriavidus basilensis]EHP44255.1 hypothetical protein OR16_04737 [Cupriavidus basilensis OR16]